jgi:hypothetical protein
MKLNKAYLKRNKVSLSLLAGALLCFALGFDYFGGMLIGWAIFPPILRHIKRRFNEIREQERLNELKGGQNG